MLYRKIKKIAGVGKNSIRFFIQFIKNCSKCAENKKYEKNITIYNFAPVQFNSTYNDNYKEGRRNINCTILKSRDGDITLYKDIQNLIEKNTDLKKNCSYCNQINETLLDEIQELCVKVLEEVPNLKSFVSKQKEIRRIISNLDTVSDVSGNNDLYNKRFIDYFKYN